MRIIASPGIRPGHKNPYTSLLYTQMTQLGAEVLEATPARIFFARGVAIWHLHWPDGALNYASTTKVLFKLCKLFVQLYWAKARGIRVLWTAHNLGAHERLHPRIESWFWSLFLNAVDGVISLSDAGRRLSVQTFPQLTAKPAYVIAHGHYRHAYPNTLTRRQARSALGIAPELRVALILGHIRPYKNVPELIHLFRSLPDPDLRLLIAGTPNTQALRDAIETACGNDPRIATHLEFVPVERVQFYLRAADLMVLPYRRVLNSGAALLALSFDCPVFAPNKGALGEIKSEVGAKWVRLFDSPLTAGQLDDALQWSAQPRPVQPDLRAYDWQVLAQSTLDAYWATMRAG